MDREILFRGKRVDNGEWIEGFIAGIHAYNTDDKTGGITHIDSYYMNHVYSVDASTVGQYTGLTDKNGKKIFEGDIVKYNNTVYEIAYITKYARFAGRKPETIMSIFPLEDSKVIGNIHDNPELMEG